MGHEARVEKDFILIVNASRLDDLLQIPYLSMPEALPISSIPEFSFSTCDMIAFNLVVSYTVKGKLRMKQLILKEIHKLQRN